ncbi:acyltransferase family protein [Herbaspirillum sp. RTI4]|uniref:acyltransferase family protein n=1 Tax=Herbaspirillum sp. RTI4 TaxID=3048640 RepID=UPI002AB5DC32|nr:acyltransferase family protein [Herbaspirillum sp. RTI4]MDY7577599.1 acyltransferase family protein [Herbaspirillum sp. RTI4]
MLHLWSLGIEEQFYILWPVIIFLIYRFRLNIIGSALFLFLISFFINIYSSESGSVSAFWLLQARAWELLIGAILADIDLNHRGRIQQYLTSRILNVFSILGILFVIIGIVVIKNTYFVPGYWALLPTVGAFFLIFSGPDAWINRWILSNKIVVYVGLISYPLYLWHWPLLYFSRILTNGTPSLEVRIATLGASFILACLSYFLIEKPVRKSGNKMVLAGLIFSLAIITCAGVVIFIRDGIPGRNPEADKISAASGEWEWPGGLTPHVVEDGKYYTAGGNGFQTLYFGDSNMEMYGARISTLVKENKGTDRGVIFVIRDGCPPIPDAREPGHAYCAGFISQFTKTAANPKVDTVVIGAAWFSYLYNGPFYVGAEKSLLSSNVGAVKAMNELHQLIATLVASHKRVYLVLNIPWGNFDPKHMIQRTLTGGFMFVKNPVPEAEFMVPFALIQSRLIDAATSAGARIINPVDTLCVNGLCPSVDRNGDPIYRDTMHLRPKFVKTQIQYLDITAISPH